MLTLVIFIVILGMLILSHEFGHFVAAKRAGMHVDEFGCGSPPKLFGFKKGETHYTLNLIPFGGFVKIYGEDSGPSDGNVADEERRFVSKSKIAQGMVIIAGVTANFILAWILFSFGFIVGLPISTSGDLASAGMLDDVRVIVTSIAEGSPAERAGIFPGDSILLLESIRSLGTPDEAVVASASDPKTPDEAADFITAIPKGVALRLVYMRGEEERSAVLVPEAGVIPSAPERRAIGISMDSVGTLFLPPHKAILYGGRQTGHIAGAIAYEIVGLARDAIFGDATLENVSGPVGLYVLVEQAGNLGFIYLVTFTALISVTLGVIN